MLIQLIIFLFLGIIAGTITGLFPGIHINLVGAALVSLSLTTLSSINSIFLIVFIVAMAITHTFLDFVPSVFLGAPDNELSILPGHELLKKGHGYQAVMLTAYGGLAAIFILIIISFPLILIIPKIYLTIENFIFYILIIASLILIFSDGKKINSLIVFVISGILGTIILNLPDNSLNNQPLLPLLSGLFGVSSLLISIKQKTSIPPQKIKEGKLRIKPILSSLISSPICAFLPGLGSGQAAVIGNTIIKSGKKSFLILLGATNTLVMGLSFIALYTVSKTRTGAAAAIKEIIGILEGNLLILILLICLISGIISFYLTKITAKFFASRIEKIDYTKISIATIIIVFIINFLVVSFFGTIILIISTLTGLYCISLEARRTNMMGCLMIPTIIYYWSLI